MKICTAGTRRIKVAVPAQCLLGEFGASGGRDWVSLQMWLRSPLASPVLWFSIAPTEWHALCIPVDTDTHPPPCVTGDPTTSSGTCTSWGPSFTTMSLFIPGSRFPGSFFQIPLGIKGVGSMGTGERIFGQQNTKK